MIPNTLVFFYYSVINTEQLKFFRSYTSLFNSSNMTLNTEMSGYDSDDFM